MANAQIIFKQDYNTKISKFLPFRISFQNIMIDAYGPASPAPIGIAVVGFNNYIL